jgi:hypothetical protein
MHLLVFAHVLTKCAVQEAKSNDVIYSCATTAKVKPILVSRKQCLASTFCLLQVHLTPCDFDNNLCAIFFMLTLNAAVLSPLICTLL